MRRLASCALLPAAGTLFTALCFLAGCAGPSASAYGNFLRAAPPALEQQLAEAAVQQLVALYPPGRTQFALQQAGADAFGQSLVAGLRGQGYALQDFQPARAPAASTGPTAPTASAAPGQPLGYLLDQAAGPELYRITLTVGAQTLTRVYAQPQGRLQPAGAWVRKE